MLSVSARSTRVVLTAAGAAAIQMAAASTLRAAIIAGNGSPTQDDPNLKAWFKADDGLVIDANGVLRWIDKSVSVENLNRSAVASLADAAHQPELVAADPQLNGMPSVNFDGVQNVMVRPLGNAPVTGNTDRTTFVVVSAFEPRAGTNNIEHIVHWGNNANDFSYGVVGAAGANRRIGNHYWNGFDPGTVAMGPNAPRLINFTYDGDASPGGTGLDSYFVNGLNAGFRDVVVGNTLPVAPVGQLKTGNNANNQFVIGSRISLSSNNPVEHMRGNIAEIIIYDQALSAADRNAVTGYLANKYGIQLGLAAPVAPAVNKADFSSLSDFTLHGTAKAALDVVDNAPVLRLHENVNNSNGAAMMTKPVTLANDYSFDTTVLFRMTNGGGVDCCGDLPGADGMTLVIHADPRGHMASGEVGGGMGFMGNNFAGGEATRIKTGVAIEFDTWHQGVFDVPTNTNTNGNHIGIDPLGGATVSIAQTGAGAIAQLADGNTKAARVTYDGKTKMMNVFYDTGASGATTQVLQKQIDLAKMFGGNHDVFLGFTGATGGANQRIDVRSFFFDSQPSGSATPVYTPVNIQFADFSDVSAWTMNGTTPPISINDRLRLTDNINNQGTSAMLTDKVALPSDYAFQARFSFELSLPGGSADGQDGLGADGIHFVIHSDPRGATAVGGAGGAMGIDGIGNRVSVELDTWPSGSFDLTGNTNGNHIAIVSSQFGFGVTSQTVAQSAPGLPRFNDGGIGTVWVEYDGTIMNVFYSTDGIKPGSPIVSSPMDLAAALGFTNEVTLGFTAGTGAANNRHEIVDFSFSTVPEPASLGLVGIAGLGLLRRRRVR